MKKPIVKSFVVSLSSSSSGAPKRFSVKTTRARSIKAAQKIARKFMSECPGYEDREAVVYIYNTLLTLRTKKASEKGAKCGL